MKVARDGQDFKRKLCQKLLEIESGEWDHFVHYLPVLYSRR